MSHLSSNTEDLEKLSRRQRQEMGFFLDHELAEIHPAVSELPTFVVPKINTLPSPSLLAFLQGRNIDVVVLQALDKQINRIHHKVGTLIISKPGTTVTVDPTTGCKEAFTQKHITLHWRDYELFVLAKSPTSDHVDTLRFFLEHYPKRTMLNKDGTRKGRNVEATRKKHQRRREVLRRAGKLEPGQAERERREERFRLRQERKEMHERIKLGRRDGSLTAEGATEMASLYSKKWQLWMLELEKKMAEHGIGFNTGEYVEECEDWPAEDAPFGYAEEMDDDEEMGSGDDGQAPEPVLME